MTTKKKVPCSARILLRETTLYVSYRVTSEISGLLVRLPTGAYAIRKDRYLEVLQKLEHMAHKSPELFSGPSLNRICRSDR